MKSMKTLMVGIISALGLTAFGGCYEEPPENTDPLGDEQLEQVEGLLSQGKYHQSGVTDLLEKSDTLFDRYGDEAEDNSDLVDMIYTLEDRLDLYLEEGRIVGNYSDGIPAQTTTGAYFLGGDTDDFTGDDYIVIRIDSNGGFTADTDSLYHEAAEAFEGHEQGMKEYIYDARDSYLFWDDADFVDTLIEEEDTPYLMTLYFGYMDNLAKWTAETGDDLISEMDHEIMFHEEGDPCIETELLNKDTWVSWQYYSQMEPKFGLTKDEIIESAGYIYDDLTTAYREALLEKDPEHEVYCWDF